MQTLLTPRTDPDEKKTDDSTRNLRHYRWVCRTDIRGYYRNISKQTLINQVSQHVTSLVLRDLVTQYIHYTVEDGGTFHTPEKGISRGCPLSPLMGALHLYDMDEHFSRQKGIHYARYMDDIVILAKTRWSLRKHTKRLMQWFSEYGFEAHPDKTQIGRTEKGFDWMGAWLTHEGVTDIAPRAKANHREKVRRLYEQLARLPKWKRKSAAPKVHARVSAYRRRWKIWAAGLLCVGAIHAACGAGDIIVLQPITGPGDLGSVFQTSGSRSGAWVQALGTNYDYGGLCLSLDTGRCSGGTMWTARKVGPLWGLDLTAAKPGLVLIPRGTISFTCTSGTCPGDLVRSLDTASGTAITQDGTTYAACSPIDGDATLRATFTSLGLKSTCPVNRATTYSGSTAGVLAFDISLQAVAISALSPGSWSPPALYAGIHSGVDTSVALTVPDRIIVVGLTCQLVDSRNGTHAFPSAVATGRPGKTLVAGLSAADLGITASCTGSNSTGSAVPISYKLTPAAGGSMRAGGKGLEVPGQPSFYMNFTRDGVPSCNESAAAAIPVDGVTNSPIASVPPGQALQPTPVNLAAALCSTGNTTQAPGDYSMSVTASIVSY
ncbi:reverse transcriptase domain-containing protein [Enterobacter asburiae]|uniref:reverse transcriptase domain-containing protein n=1 Tax=Enterobacter asburiae TaxID=61645 RepID=UPI00163C98E1|nr:reverse transcriptase domain-containing protein [Enterobacter asburiae]